MGRGGVALEVESTGPMVHDDSIVDHSEPPVKARKNEIVPKFGRFTQAISNWTSPRHQQQNASPTTREGQRKPWSEDEEAKEMAERRKDAETVAARLEEHLSSTGGKGSTSPASSKVTPASSTGAGTPAGKQSPTQPTQGGANKTPAKASSPGGDQPGFIARMLGWGGEAAPKTCWPGDGHLPSAHKVEMLVGEWTVFATITGATTQSPASSISYRPYVAYAILVELSLGEDRGKASYMVSRRFSRFMELHRQLRKDYPPEDLPKHPPKEPFCSSVDPAVVGPRMESLQTYLLDLMQRPEVARGEALSSFLELNSASQLIASAI